MLFPLTHGGSRRVAATTLAGVSLVAAAAVGSLFLGTARDAWTAIDAAGPAGPADGILLIAGLGGALLSLWLGLGLTLSALSALPGALGQVSRSLAQQIAPAAVRKLVAFVLGTTLTAALVPGTATARDDHQSARPAVVAAAGHTMSSLADAAPDASFRLVRDPIHHLDVLDAAPRPTWSQDGPGQVAKPRQPPGTGPAADRVVVRRGDTLWSIAARHLGPAATLADIDAEWPRWLSANRDVIGEDANLILPGQQLRPPATTPMKPTTGMNSTTRIKPATPSAPERS
jgi:LysM domain